MKSGRFTGTFTLRLLGHKRYLKFWTRALYCFETDPANPLTYHCSDGAKIRPMSPMTTDMGTVPRVARILISKDRYLKSYLIHDSGYEQAGRQVARYGSDDYGFMPYGRRCIDRKLRECIASQGGGRLTRNAIYAAVRAGGGRLWRRRHGSA